MFVMDGSSGGLGIVVLFDGYVIMNFYVVCLCGNFMKCLFLNGKFYDVVFVGVDLVGDVVFICIVGEDLFLVVEIVNSCDVCVGDWCFVIGNFFLFVINYELIVIYGLVLGVYCY